MHNGLLYIKLKKKFEAIEVLPLLDTLRTQSDVWDAIVRSSAVRVIRTVYRDLYEKQNFVVSRYSRKGRPPEVTFEP